VIYSENGETSISTEPMALFGFAGIDGAGKTTLLNGLLNHLESNGNRVFVSKAYHGGYKQAFSEFIESADDTEIMFMFQAFQRRQRNDALAHLALGEIVLADRWDESYEAHHSQNGLLAQLPDLRSGINHITFEGLKPHTTFYVQTKPSVANMRVGSRGLNDFFDVKAADHHKAQAKYYDERADMDESWVTLDGHQSPEEILSQAIALVEATNIPTSLRR
jgi:thymidylate kinase